MIDFIRIKYQEKGVIEPYVCNEDNFQELKAQVEYHTGEIHYPYKANIKNIEINVNNKHVYVKNSLHKLNNELEGEGKQNYNDFTHSSLVTTIDYLLGKLPDLDSAIITQIEFGLNVNTDRPAEEIIKENVIMHLFKEHSHNKRFRGRGEYKQFDHYNYFIKIYDKAKQFTRSENILRVEIKFIRKREFNKLGIYTISDLKSKEVLDNAFQYLMKRFDELVIVDRIDSKDIPQKVIKELGNYLSPHFWLRLSDRAKRSLKSRHKRNFQEILNEYNLLTTRNHLSELLTDKFNHLLNS